MDQGMLGGKTLGEIADMIIEGVLCEICGGLVDGKESGYPRKCEDCEED